MAHALTWCRRISIFVATSLFSACVLAAAPTIPLKPVSSGAAHPLTTQGVTTSSGAQPDVTQQLQMLINKKNPQQALGQAVVMGMMFSCIDKQVSKDTVQAFYKQMEQVGKTADGYCKAGKADQARSLMLSTFQARRHDPVVRSALSCYEQQRMGILGMGGQKLASDMEHYARWVRDPSLATKEMTEADICK